MTNVIDLMTGKRQQSDGTPIPIVLGGGHVFRCGRCSRTFTAETWHVVENMRQDPDGLAWHTEVCRRCAYGDSILCRWQNLCDVLDSIDGVMQDAADADARGLLYSLIENAAGHFAVWRWPDEEMPASVTACRCHGVDDEDEDEDE